MFLDWRPVTSKVPQGSLLFVVGIATLDGMFKALLVNLQMALK